MTTWQQGQFDPFVFLFWYGSFLPIPLYSLLRAILARGYVLAFLQVILTYIPQRKGKICPAIKYPLNWQAARKTKIRQFLQKFINCFHSPTIRCLLLERILRKKLKVFLSSSRRNQQKDNPLIFTVTNFQKIQPPNFHYHRILKIIEKF